MLEGKRTLNLTYSSMIGNKCVVYMTASVPENGRINTSKTIQDKSLYEANKEECRRDMAAFDEILWKLEDNSAADNAEEQKA